jgi:hypothetical protein
LSAIPYLCQAVLAFVGGHIADILRSKGILTTTAVRRLFELTGKNILSNYVSEYKLPINERNRVF